MTDLKSLEDKLLLMNKAELVSYANLTYGLNVNSRFTTDDLISSIKRSAQKFAGNTQIEINEKVLKIGYARIKINKTELNKQGRPVIVGLNGRQYSLPIGVELNVPQPLVEILNNAVQYQYESDPTRDNEMIKREVHAYPFTVLEMAEPLPKKPQPEPRVIAKRLAQAADDLQLKTALASLEEE